jgi:hypothetical protein
MSDTTKKLKELLPVWAELTGVIIKLVCKLLLEIEGKDEQMPARRA